MPKPANNPSKPPHSKSKRTRTTSPSGWTYITKGPTPHLPHSQTTALQQQHHQEQQSTTLEPHITRFKTYYLPQWQSSTCWTNLSLLFKDEIIPSLPAQNQITNCVCLGLGSLTTSNGTNSSTQASWWQISCLVSIIELLLLLRTEDNNDSKEPIPFPITFQDPIFTPTDEIFLTEYLPSFFHLPSSSTSSTTNHAVPVPIPVTVSVVKDPEAFARIDRGTFLFAPHLEVGIFARALEGERGEGTEGGPVCCIGSDVGGYVDGLVISPPSPPRLLPLPLPLPNDSSPNSSPISPTLNTIPSFLSLLYHHLLPSHLLVWEN